MKWNRIGLTLATAGILVALTAGGSAQPTGQVLTADQGVELRAGAAR